MMIATLHNKIVMYAAKFYMIFESNCIKIVDVSMSIYPVTVIYLDRSASNLLFEIREF